MPPPQEIIRPYQGTINHDPLISKALLRPYFLGGGGVGGDISSKSSRVFSSQVLRQHGSRMGAVFRPTLLIQAVVACASKGS